MLLGGARSGKSALAVRWGDAHGGPVTFVATGQAADDEMAARIRQHRAVRPASWTTVEAPTGLVAAVADAPDEALVIVDCLTLWVANVFGELDDEEVLARAGALGAAAAGRPAPTVIVSNEVGTGIVPADPATRRYRDLLGGVNATVVSHAVAAWLLVAGRALPLQPLPTGPTGG
ncbi:MAG TPA: bifunctional adenosylcobinamide kinase/adenosylcobinamide-phosphate guanylyltransferase [Euzebyales bacterium]|nr:bifunctional adenosylcobinamide kinase/adenosylcobinamide-phosphate guanylyltransferase [Euzebyales bacterium]